MRCRTDIYWSVYIYHVYGGISIIWNDTHFAMLNFCFLLCGILSSPGAAKTSLWLWWLKWREIPHTLPFPTSLLSSLRMRLREGWKEIAVFLHRCCCWVQPLHTDWPLHSFPNVNTFMGFICGFYRDLAIGNLLHIKSYSHIRDGPVG